MHRCVEDRPGGLGPVWLMILDALFILSKACIFLFVGKISLFLQRSGFLFIVHSLNQGFFGIFGNIPISFSDHAEKGTTQI